MKRIFIGFLVLIIVLFSSIGYAAEDFAEAKKLIDAKTPCSKLTENQLESIGDYYMEQMHPGEAHETMEKMMGGEGSESLRLMHIAMAKRLYCNDINSSINYGFNGMMGMKNGGMTDMMENGFGTKVMGNYGYWGFYNFLTIVLFVGLIILVYLWIIKVWKEIFRKR